MVCSIIASLASLAWALLLLLVIIYLFAICFAQALTGYLKSDENSNLDSDAVAGIEQWYSSLTMSMFSLMLAISGGMDWYDLQFPLETIPGIGWVYTFAFLIYVFFIIFGVLNVLVGVFLASAAEMLDRDVIVQSEIMRNNQAMKEMLQLFEEIDKNGTGFISWVEFQEYLEDEKAQAFLQVHSFDTSDPTALFGLMDVDDDGQVDSEEFIMAMMKIKGQAKGSDLLSLIQDSADSKRQMKDLMEATNTLHDDVRRRMSVFEQKSLDHQTKLMERVAAGPPACPPGQEV
jgi:hypothetical protein